MKTYLNVFSPRLAKTVLIVLGLLGSSLVPSLHACGGNPRLLTTRLENSAKDGFSPAEIAELRQRGPAGLASLLVIEERWRSNPENAGPRLAKLRSAIDQVAQQKDAAWSKLYWHTDIESAKAEARTKGKPVLSLRLLGKLNEDFSCANSRFFRTALYANAQVSGYLRDHYVLHWESVRNGPRVTIDFGSGRRLERTIAGNSVHYILDADGRPIDVLPGMYGPAAFMEGLERGVILANQLRDKQGDERDRVLSAYHRGEARRLEELLAGDLALVKGDIADLRADAASPMANSAATGAGGSRAARIATSKLAIERPLVRSVSPAVDFGGSVADRAWRNLGKFYYATSALDANSTSLMREKTFGSGPGALRNGAAGSPESPMWRMVENFQRSISEDTARNELDLHHRIHVWFSGGEPSRGVAELNERVYAELFLMPLSDPWLGLKPGDTYAGLDEPATR
jgi:hypothetical protein